MTQKIETLDQYLAFVDSLDATRNQPQNDRLVHAALGLASELLEASLAPNKGELLLELGDLMFFAGMLVNITGFRDTDIESVAVAAHTNTSACVEAIVSEVKRRVVCDKSKLDDKQLAVLGFAVLELVYADGGPLVLEMNVQKLRARYPRGTFSADDAMARADESNTTHIACEPATGEINPDENKVA